LNSHSQNPVGFENGIGKSGQKPSFSPKSKVAFPKNEVLGKPQITPFLSLSGRPGFTGGSGTGSSKEEV
jgi:hypothetical protein